MNTTQIDFGKPWIGPEEREAVLAVLDQPVLTHGPQTHAFEEEFAAFAGGGSAVATSSCMGALHLACWELGFGPGDDVLVPAQTHTATVHAVEMVGARPVFVDCNPDTGNVTVEGLSAAITPATKGIVLVHFLGIPCEMGPIMAFANNNNLKVLEDCALAVGAKWQGVHVGLHGDAGAFSFYPAKHITTGEGGMLLTKHAGLAENAMKRRGFGVDRTIAERTIPGIYDVTQLGVNYRMSELNAAIGRCQIRKVPEILARRKQNFEKLRELMSGWDGVSIIDSSSSEAAVTHYCFSVVLPPALRGLRNEFVLKLKEMKFGCSVYYPQPVPRLTYYRNKYGYVPGSYPAAELISDGSIALPVGPHLTTAEMARIGEALRSISESLGK